MSYVHDRFEHPWLVYLNVTGVVLIVAALLLEFVVFHELFSLAPYTETRAFWVTFVGIFGIMSIALAIMGYVAFFALKVGSDLYERNQLDV